MADHEHDNADLLNDYVERLLAIEGDGAHRLDDDDLRRVARELGLSDEDLARVDKVVGDHLTRGQNFVARGLYREAADEIQQAAVLRPFDAAIATRLARAHLGHFHRTGERQARDRAQRWARRAIDIDADHKPAFDVLEACQQPRGNGKRAFVAAAALGLLGAGIGGALWLSQDDGAEVTDEPKRIQTTGSKTPTPVTPVVPVRTELEPVVAASPEADVPLSLVDDMDTGVTLDVQRSRLKRYSGASFSYTLRGTLTAGTKELKLLRARLELLGPDGTALIQKSEELYKSFRPGIRPGESAPAAMLLFQKRPAPDIASARLVVELADVVPAAETYAEEPVVSLTWPGRRPAHIDVVARERKSEVKDLFSKRSHWLTLSIENRGTRPVSSLRLEVAVAAKDGTELARGTTLFVSRAGPALSPGQTWVTRLMTDIGPAKPAPGKRFASYAVHVVEAD